VRNRRTHAIRTTIVGGLLFLIPFVVVVAVVGKTYAVMSKIAQPIADATGIDHVGFVAIIDLVTLLLTLMLCYLAGLVAVSERGRRAFDSTTSHSLRSKSNGMRRRWSCSCRGRRTPGPARYPSSTATGSLRSIRTFSPC